MEIFNLSESRFQPQSGYGYENAKASVDQRFLAAVVGIVAMGLPIVIILGSLVGHLWRDSISHYYYAPVLGEVFVGALVFIGTFLFAYRGEHPAESMISSTAAPFAFGVALLPTTGGGVDIPAGTDKVMFPARLFAEVTAAQDPDPAKELIYSASSPAIDTASHFQLFPSVSFFHFLSAGILFLLLAYFCFVVFTRSVPGQEGSGSAGSAKRIRNTIYKICGSLILLSIVALLSKLVLPFDSFWNKWNLTFWFEAVALWAFGFAWMVKGRFFMKYLLDERDRAKLKEAATG